MPIISVIVPIYNAENYLHECVDSILAQTIHDIEVILVDDGSTDGSPAICDVYAQKDSRVYVIHKPNGRAASARNAGLRIAKGEYIAFVDADDWIEPEMYERMIGTSVDVCLCDYARFDHRGAEFFSQPNIRYGYYDQVQIKQEVYPHLVMDGLEYPVTISNCVMLMRHEIIRANKLSYRSDILVDEDATFGSEVLFHAKSFFYMKGEIFYHYRKTEGSASRTYKAWWWDSYLKINEELETFFGQCKDFNFSQQIKSNMFYLSRAIIYYILSDKTLSIREQNQKVRAVMNHPRVVRMLKDFNMKGQPLSFKAVYWSIYYKSVLGRRFVSFLSFLRHRVTDK